MKHYCKNHPNKLALSFCNNCKNYYCEECLNEGKEYYYCNNLKCYQKYEEEITPKNKIIINNFFERKIKRRTLIITPKEIQFGSRKIFTESLNGFFHCTVDITINFARNVTHSIHFRDKNNYKIHIPIDGGPFKNKQKLFDEYNLILNAIYEIVIPGYLSRIVGEILNGEERKIGNCILTKDGVYTLSSFPFYNKKDFIEYHDVIFQDKRGKVLLRSQKYKDIKAKIDMLKDWDSAIIKHLVKFLTNN